jgi:hypothetical protein
VVGCLEVSKLRRFCLLRRFEFLHRFLKDHQLFSNLIETVDPLFESLGRATFALHGPERISVFSENFGTLAFSAVPNAITPLHQPNGVSGETTLAVATPADGDVHKLES